MAPGEYTPDPLGARTPAEFLARLQALKDRSGLTYRELAARAEARGDLLPRSTVANMLSRTTLPREELLTAFVRACGVAPAELESWRKVRSELAGRGTYAPTEEAGTEAAGTEEAGTEAAGTEEAGTEEAGTEQAGTEQAGTEESASEADQVSGSPAPPSSWPQAAEPPASPPPGARFRLRRAVVATVAVAGLVLAGVSAVAAFRDGRTGHAGHPGQGGQPPRTPAAPAVPAAPAAGDVRIRVTGTDFCLGERRGTRSGQIHQLPCAEAGVPLYSLAAVAGGRWRIVSDHPDYGPGCSGIPSGGRIPGAAYEDSECGDPSRVETFALQPYGTPVRGHRIVPVGSATPGSCVTVTGDRMAAGARLAQAPCAPDAAGQLFVFERRQAPGG
ncbi:helix-turn-helix transcriptional regulator [Streptomyces sp. NPDC051742]|uniref:helix-turn-helix transcriptional regulator n=1 Tax=unclassified Streptomyces TaxID=2593676 RepID=UPI003421283A